MITGSIVALVTPMNADGDIDWPALERLVELHIDAGTSALGVVGTTGESSTLSHAEHCEVIRFTARQAGGRIPIVAGTGSNSTREAIELSAAAAEAGADATLSVVPYYNRPTQEGMFQHFATIARAVNLPMILYNVPSRTGCDLSNDTVLRLSQIENIVGLKDATGDVARGAALIKSLPSSFAVYSGDDPTALDLMRVGAKGNISVTANIEPNAVAEMCRAALNGDFDAAAAVDQRLSVLNAVLFIEPNPIPVKWAMGFRGVISHGLRLPLTILSASGQNRVQQALEQFDA